MNPTSKPLSITLDGKKYKMHFDLNTFDKYEEISKKHFLEFLASMQEALASIPTSKIDPKTKKITPPKPEDMFGFLRKLSIKDLRAFVYAALHDYDRDGEPVWPLTIGQMGRLVTTETIPTIISLVMRGTQENNPGPDDLKEAGDSGEKIRPIRAGETAPADGGPGFGPSDEDILGSLTRTSGA
jgi:hypothetical protein